MNNLSTLQSEMEDQVPFKAYAFFSNQSKPEVRRFGVDKSVITSFHYLNAKLQEVYPSLKSKTYSVAWRDEDGDDITISSDEEVMIALSQMHADLIKLYIYCKDKADDKDDECEILLTTYPDSSAAAHAEVEHFGVMCDCCDKTVYGFRYKCTVCHDFDLCSTCEAAGKHASHCMVRIPTPNMPHALIKAAIKRSRHFLKTVAVKEECPYKKNKHDRSGERKQNRDGENYQRRERHYRRPRGSWLDTFATYMNEFANLAGDIDCHPPTEQKPNGETENINGGGTSTQNTNSNVQAENTINGNAVPKPANDTTARPSANDKPTPDSAKKRCEAEFNKLINPENVKYLIDLQKTLTNILIPNLVPDKPDTAAASVNTDVEMGQGDRKSPEADRTSVKSASSASSGDAKFIDPLAEKADDWTMINKDNDLMDVAAALAQPSAPVEGTSTPIGFNLPQEFQDRVRIEGQSLYPPLNTATAEPEAKAVAQQPTQIEPQPKPAQSAESQPQPTAQTQPQQPKPAQLPPPKPRHLLKPHIAAALDHMLAMGFNNDGGWITQLLENYDGNISAVLDLLTPVAPKKK